VASQQELDQCYMAVAEAHAKLSKGVRAKVGAALVTQKEVILAGYNGLAPEGSNILEHVNEEGFFVTKEEVIHAEINCILKAAKEGVSVVGGTLYITLSPCLSCAEMIKAAGIKRVVYRDQYRCKKGIYSLIEYGIQCNKLEEMI